MITPEQLNRLAKDNSEKHFEEAMKDFEPLIKEELSKGRTRIQINACFVNESISVCYDEKEDWFVRQLKQRGFKVEKISEIVGGVRQMPIWYLYF